MLNTLQVAFLQGLLRTRPEKKQATETASRLAEQYGVGMKRGRRVVYSPSDFLGAERLLLANQMPLAAQAKVSRADRAIYPGLSEKIGSLRPHENSVALRSASGAVHLGEAALVTEPGSYLVTTVEQAAQSDADRIMVVENLETFRWLNRQGWIDYEGGKTLALFRGDTTTSPRDCNRLLSMTTLPVWAFFDFDPAGIGMAMGIERLERLVLPDAAWLAPMARDKKRSDLFHDSLNQWQAMIAQCRHPSVEKAWDLLNGLGYGLPQEWMEAAVGML